MAELPDLIVEAAWNGQAGPAYREAVLADFPAVYLRLGESTGNPLDSSGNGLTATLPNGATRAVAGALPGDPDAAIGLNGTTQYVNVATASVLDALVDAWTVEAWVYPTAARGSASGIVTRAYPGSGSVPFTLGYGNPNTEFGAAFLNVNSCAFAGFFDGTSWRVVTDGAALPLNAWTHLVATWDGTTITLYRNAVAVASAAPGVADVAHTGQAVYVGQRWDTAGTSRLFPGRIDEVALYPQALVPTEVEYHYEARNAVPTEAWEWTDISGRVRRAAGAVTTSRGRKDEEAHADEGRFSVTLRNDDRRFEANFAGVLTNLITNPSFEVDTTGASPTGAGGSSIARNTSQSEFGAAALLVSTDGTVAEAGAVISTSTGLALPPGTVITVSCWVRGASNTGTIEVWGRVENSDSTATDGAKTTVTPGQSWARASATVTVAAGKTCDSVRVQVTTNSARVASFFVDGVQVEEASVATAYCDGDQDNCRWAGTPHESQSYRGGPYYPNVRTGIPIRVRADNTANGDAVHPVIAGFVDTILEHWLPYNYYGEVTLECYDGVSWLSQANVYVGRDAPQELTDARIKRTLKAAGARVDAWLDKDGSAAEASTYEVPAATISGSALSHIQEVEATEGGLLVPGKSHWEWLWLPSKIWNATTDGGRGFATWDYPYGNTGGSTHLGVPEKRLQDISPYIDEQRLHNVIAVTRDGGVPMTAADAASRRKHGLRFKSVSTLHVTDADALDFAKKLLARPGNITPDPQRRFDTFTVRLSGSSTVDEITTALSIEIGHVVAMFRAMPGSQGGGNIAGLHVVEGMAWSAGDEFWDGVFQLSPAVG